MNIFRKVSVAISEMKYQLRRRYTHEEINTVIIAVSALSFFAGIGFVLNLIISSLVALFAVITIIWMVVDDIINTR